MRVVAMGLFVLTLGCGDGETGNGFAGCGDIATNCAPTIACSTAMCPFDSSSIDCTAACENLLAVCAGECSSVNCAAAIDMPACLEACGLETGFSCGNATFGCYALNSTCTSIAQCLGCSP